MIDSRKIAEYRVLLIRQRVSQSPHAKIELMETVIPDLGELLAMADAFSRMRRSFLPSCDGQLWPESMTPESLKVLSNVVKSAMREFEFLEQARVAAGGD